MTTTTQLRDAAERLLQLANDENCEARGIALEIVGLGQSIASAYLASLPPADGWPDGLEQLTHYEFPCDDKGRDGGTWMRVMVAGDGDVHVSMQDWEDIREEGSKPSPFPSVRCRTHAGGGRHRRTRQALLNLANAIRLDQLALSAGGEGK